MKTLPSQDVYKTSPLVIGASYNANLDKKAKQKNEYEIKFNLNGPNADTADMRKILDSFVQSGLTSDIFYQKNPATYYSRKNADGILYTQPLSWYLVPI